MAHKGLPAFVWWAAAAVTSFVLWYLIFLFVGLCAAAMRGWR